MAAPRRWPKIGGCHRPPTLLGCTNHPGVAARLRLFDNATSRLRPAANRRRSPRRLPAQRVALARSEVAQFVASVAPPVASIASRTLRHAITYELCRQKRETRHNSSRQNSAARDATAPQRAAAFIAAVFSRRTRRTNPSPGLRPGVGLHSGTHARASRNVTPGRSPGLERDAERRTRHTHA
jgi:hypothetical protein